MTAPAARGDVRARQQHFGQFYELRAIEPGDDPLVLVHGNCQAEALRVLLDGPGPAPGPGRRTVRTPPVHELGPPDLPHLDRLLARVDVLVVQPVRDGYHGLPVGTREVVERSAATRVVVVPIVRHHTLHPYQVLVRGPGVGDPPIVPYHDLRTVARAAGTPLPAARPEAIREVGRRATAELVRRQRQHGTVPVADLLDAAGVRAAHTVNHPGNQVLVGLARRVQRAAGLPEDATDPGRVLLGGVVAPVDAVALQAAGLDAGAARRHWTVHGGRRERRGGAAGAAALVRAAPGRRGRRRRPAR